MSNGESVVGSVIQATGMVEFEDSLKIGDQSEAFSGSTLYLRSTLVDYRIKQTKSVISM